MSRKSGAARTRARPVAPIGKAEYDRRHLNMPWPSGTEGTIELAPFWPGANDQTILATHHPDLAGPNDDSEAAAQLREIKRRLDME